jgi:transposase
MKRFVEGEDRRQGVLLPEFLDDYLAEDNPVRAIDVFVDELDLRGLTASSRKRRAVRPTIPRRC